MIIEHIEMSDDKTIAVVTTINGFWFSASRHTETYIRHAGTWKRSSDMTFCPTWISLAIEKEIH